MRKLALLLLLGVAAGNDEKPSPIEFSEAPPKAGMLLEEKSRITAEVEVDASQEGRTVAEYREVRVQSRSRRMVFTKGGDAAEARVRYGICRVARKGDQGTHDFEDVVSNKTYHLKREADRLKVTDENGKTPPAIELDFVRKDLARFDGRHPLGDLLAGKRIQPGDSLGIPESLVAEMLKGVDQKGEAQVRKGTLTCRGLEATGDRAGFDVSVELEARDANEGNTTLPLSGRLVVLLEGARPVLLEVSGPMSHRSQDKEEKLDIEVKGRVEIHLSVVVSKEE